MNPSEFNYIFFVVFILKENRISVAKRGFRKMFLDDVAYDFCVSFFEQANTQTSFTRLPQFRSLSAPNSRASTSTEKTDSFTDIDTDYSRPASVVNVLWSQK